MSEIVKVEEPTVMEISGYCMLHQKLNYLTSELTTKAEADVKTVTIQSYKRPVDVKDKKTGLMRREIESVVRFKTDSKAWFEVNTLKEYGGDILPFEVTVNLYDVFALVDQSKTEMVSFWIDEEVNELVMTSYYIPELDYDELEVRLPIHNRCAVELDTIEQPTKPNTTLKISPSAIFTTLREINIENQCEYLHFKFNDGMLYLMAEYHGVQSMVELKEQADFDYGSATDFKLPFGVFFMMGSTGSLDDLSIDLYDEYVITSMEEYSFKVPRIPSELDLDRIMSILPKDHEPVFVVDPTTAFSSLEKLIKISSADYHEIEYNKVENGVADLVLVVPNRAVITNRMSMATIKDEKVKFDGELFMDLFNDNNVTGVALHSIDGVYVIKYDTALLHKTMIYDHNAFIEYRKSQVSS